MIKTFLLLLSVLIPYIGVSQNNDFGIWSTLGAEKKLGKWDIGVATNLRSKDNSDQIDRWSVEAGIGYTILKPLKVGAAYEYMYYNDTKYSDFQNRYRGSFYIQGKEKLGRFTFSLTEKIQVTSKDETDRVKSNGNIDTYRVNPAWAWRNKIKIAYNIPKVPITPALSAESSYTLNDPDGNSFYKIRYTLGFTYKFRKHHEVEIYGLIDDEIDKNNPTTSYIAGIAYIYSF